MQSDTNYTLAFHALFPFTSTLKREIDRYFSILKKNHLVVFFKCTRNDKNMGNEKKHLKKQKLLKQISPQKPLQSNSSVERN